MNRDPPSGYSRCSVSQIVAADKAVWQKIIEEGVRPKRSSTGELPLGDAMLEALKSYEVSFLLLPLQSKKENPKDKKAKKETREQSDKVWNSPKKGNGKGKSKGKTPQGILKLGGVSKTPEGENLCFASNLSGCSEAADGSGCRRGYHLCAKCFGNHPIGQHDSQ